MFKFLTSIHVETINFYLDSPVSNSGSLKLRILEYAEKYNLKTNVELVNNADVILEKLSNVITSDATILDKCSSYFNLSKNIIDEYIKDARIISLT